MYRATAAVMRVRESDAGDEEKKRQHNASPNAAEFSVPADFVSRLYSHIDQMRFGFFGGDLPDVTLSFDTADKRMRGSHRVQVERVGRRWVINLNPVHLAKPLNEVLAALLHELVHVWQHERGTPSKAPYHNAEFRKLSAELGVPVDERGHSLGLPPGTKFARYCVASATVPSDIRGPHVATIALATPAPKGSKLRKWTCACGINVRVAVATFDATCNRCGSFFRRVD